MKQLYNNLTLSARHYPDYSLDAGPDGNKVKSELPGTIEFGVEVDGVWVPLEKRKAAGLFADIQRAKDNPPAKPEPQD